MKKIFFIAISIFTVSFQISAQQPVQQREWNLVWSDEFNTPGPPDPTKWDFDVEGNAWGWGNNELQNYTPRNHPNPNAWVENGRLIIEARRETFTHSGHTRDYTSARLRTINRGDWLYGRIDVRARMPAGRGTWAAIWMLPTDSEYGNWPSSGEIDNMEYVGFQPGEIHWTLHTEAFNHMLGTQVGSSRQFVAPEVNFYTYTVEWCENKIDFIVDDTVHFTYHNESGFTHREWPFDKRFHLILNIAIGGGWGGLHGVDNSIFPVQMEVDYVRVFEEVLPGPFTITTSSTPGGVISVSPQRAQYARGETVTITAIPNQGYTFRRFSGNITPSSAPEMVFQITRNMNIEALFAPAGEVLFNGDFSDGLIHWSNYTNSAARATTQVNSDGQLEVNITRLATNPWDIRVNQTNIPLIQGNRYRFSFYASHSNSGSISAGVARNAAPWTPYRGETVSLTPQMQRFEFDFTMTSPNDTNARIFFDVGINTGVVRIDNVSLTNLDAETTSILNSGSSIENESLDVFPNPFNPIANIEFNLSKNQEKSTLKILDINGRTIETTYFHSQGRHTHRFDGSNLPSGIYFVRLEAGTTLLQRKMVLLK